MSNSSMFAGLSVVMLVAGVALAIAVFLLLREFWCWYWKVNQVVASLERIEGYLARAERREIARDRDEEARRTA